VTILVFNTFLGIYNRGTVAHVPFSVGGNHGNASEDAFALLKVNLQSARINCKEAT
jgi:hypothetical protein